MTKKIVSREPKNNATCHGLIFFEKKPRITEFVEKWSEAYNHFFYQLSLFKNFLKIFF